MSLNRSNSINSAPPTTTLQQQQQQSQPSSTVTTQGNTSQSGQQQQQQQQSSPSSSNSTATTTQDPTFGPLSQAARVVNDRLQKDEQWTGVADRLGYGSSFDYVPPPNAAWVPYQKRRVISLPDRLFEEYNAKAHCTMGLLPAIERSWVTIDNRLLLWDWAEGSSFSTFDELNSIIIGVGLVRPKTGVFVDSISHLLVLSTVSSIHLVGLGYAAPSPGAKPEITFYMTGLSVPSDGLPFTQIRGTAEGRIFLATSSEAVVPGGSDGNGCLYELAYQAQEGWFVKRVSLNNLTSGGVAQSLVPSFLRSLSAVPTKDFIIAIEVDDERGLLYTLLKSGVIEMYDLPSTNAAQGKRFDGVPVRAARTGDVLRQARDMCKTPATEASGVKIVQMETISMKEGDKDKVGLVAITNTGVRLYFTHQRRFPSYGAYSARSLELFHVRPPPVNHQQSQQAATTVVPNGYYGSQPQAPPTPQSRQQQQQQQGQQANSGGEFAFKAVFQARYSTGGLLLAANNRTEEIGVLFLAAPDNTASSQQSNGASGTGTAQPAQRFSEIAATIEIGGQTWDMAEITPSAPGATVTGRTSLNELATQGTSPRREWVVLTDSGANVVVRQRPVDTLVDILEGSALGSNGAQGEVGIFFNTYGLNQSCAMLLLIAAANSRLALSESSPTATGVNGNGAIGFGGGARSSFSVADHAKTLFFEYGGRPVAIDRGGYGAQNASSDANVIFSGRHEGLAFYIARLLRPIWSQKITLAAPSPTAPSRQVANVSEAVLTNVQRDLISLRTFVEQEQQLFALPTDLHRSPQVAHAYQTEHASLTALRLLLVQSVEAISFILLLIDYQISDIIGMCDPETQKTLLGLTYADLLTKKQGRDVARSLVSAVINQQIGRQLSVDAISDTLQQRCGSFCSADDVLLYKAIESLRRARDTADNSERTECLRESLRLFIKAAKHLSFERMKEVCAEFNAMRYPLGVIDLAIACAHEWDSTDRAVSFWLDGQPTNDARSSAYDLRTRCYAIVFEALQHTDDLLNEASNPDARAGGPSYAEADGLRTNAYNKALSIRDELFHAALYDWYLSRGMTDQLLETRTPYLEGYLSRDPSTLEKSDLLWQYYVRLSHYAAAASVLAALAETSAYPLSIQKRVEYLSLAVGNAKSQFPANRGDAVQFLTDIEEKLEVAQVQIEIYRAIEELDLPAEDEKRQWLDKVEDRLYTISELYSEFAEPLELLEIVLLIFHVSDHRDEFLVTATWGAIVARAQEENADQAIEILAAKVVDLGRRFSSSDVAFPLPILVNMLEKFSYERRAGNRPGWVPVALHDAGVPWDSIFAVFDEMLTAKVPPWHTSAGLVFLATDVAVMLESWLAEVPGTSTLSTHQYHRQAQHHDGPFPASSIETTVGKVLMSLASGQSGSGSAPAADVTSRLQEVQRELRRRF